ncbi:MAG: T9SS type A sorting domain-containing protein [Bacteroidia bacterium]
MKQKFYKLLSTGVSVFLLNSFAIAQCTPDPSIKTTGVFPTSLPAGRVGQAYDQVLQYYIVKDTVVNVPGLGNIAATIDSFTITNITGYPTGLNYQCNTSNCNIAGGGNGCVKVSGTPTQKGVFPLQIFIKIKASAFGVSQNQYDTITNYVMTVNSGVSVKNTNKIDNFEYEIFPNPIVNNQFNLSVWNKNSTQCTVKIFNIQGALVALQLVNLNAGFNQQNIQLDGISKGIYLLQIENETNQFHQKIVVE